MTKKKFVKKITYSMFVADFFLNFFGETTTGELFMIFDKKIFLSIFFFVYFFWKFEYFYLYE